MNSHLLPLFISCRSSGEKLIKYQIKIISSKLILCDHVPDSHGHSILQSIDITGRKLMLITLKKVYTLYVFMYSSILRIFVKNYENLVAITLSLLITELKFKITRLGNISFLWDESKAWLFIHSQTVGVLYVAIEPLITKISCFSSLQLCFL